MKILLSARKDPVNYIDALRPYGCECTVYDGSQDPTEYDGLLLCGGGDIAPRYFGQQNLGSVGIDAERDAWEFEILDAFVKAGKAVLGICRGCQLINVYFGGNLIQHLPSASLHCGKEDRVHTVHSRSGSYMEQLYGPCFAVNSAHHQGAGRIGESLRVTLWAEDVVEALEHTTLPIVAVQFHPERMTGVHRRQDTVDGEKIFKLFAYLCKGEI